MYGRDTFYLIIIYSGIPCRICRLNPDHKGARELPCGFWCLLFGYGWLKSSGVFDITKLRDNGFCFEEIEDNW